MSVLLARLDLTDEEVRKDCECELRRAQMGGGDALARWAGRWGDALVAHLQADETGEVFDPCG